jgi:archaellum biogenesis protein FlaJ (TadC family)
MFLRPRERAEFLNRLSEWICCGFPVEKFSGGEMTIPVNSRSEWD